MSTEESVMLLVPDNVTLTLELLSRPVARGGVGGVVRPPPQLPIPKILFHPLAILFHPLAILFHPSAILFHPWTWNMWMTSHGQCPRGGACECPRVGAFFKLMTSRGQCPRGGGCAWWFHPSKFRPPPPTWLAGYGPAKESLYYVGRVGLYQVIRGEQGSKYHRMIYNIKNNRCYKCAKRNSNF